MWGPEQQREGGSVRERKQAQPDNMKLTRRNSSHPHPPGSCSSPRHRRSCPAAPCAPPRLAARWAPAPARQGGWGHRGEQSEGCVQLSNNSRAARQPGREASRQGATQAALPAKPFTRSQPPPPTPPLPARTCAAAAAAASFSFTSVGVAAKMSSSANMSGSAVTRACRRRPSSVSTASPMPAAGEGGSGARARVWACGGHAKTAGRPASCPPAAGSRVLPPPCRPASENLTASRRTHPTWGARWALPSRGQARCPRARHAGRCRALPPAGKWRAHA